MRYNTVLELLPIRTEKGQKSTLYQYDLHVYIVYYNDAVLGTMPLCCTALQQNTQHTSNRPSRWASLSECAQGLDQHLGLGIGPALLYHGLGGDIYAQKLYTGLAYKSPPLRPLEHNNQASSCQNLLLKYFVGAAALQQ